MLYIVGSSRRINHPVWGWGKGKEQKYTAKNAFYLNAAGVG